MAPKLIHANMFSWQNLQKIKTFTVLKCCYALKLTNIRNIWVYLWPCCEMLNLLKSLLSYWQEYILIAVVRSGFLIPWMDSVTKLYWITQKHLPMPSGPVNRWTVILSVLYHHGNRDIYKVIDVTCKRKRPQV